jgi:ATP-binding cassette subfamily B multidrug efflux pump
VKQWKITGRLNAHIEEMYTGHALVKVFGRAEESAAMFREQNERCTGPVSGRSSSPASSSPR